jgi:hypothetical protein
MLARTESFWFEGLKYAEDDVQIANSYGDTAHESYFKPPVYGLVSEASQVEFENGYFDGIQHYKRLGLIL